jgi:hypothetical protein
MPRVLFLAICFAACAAAADPRPKPADYPAHAESPKLDIGAEYLVHSFSNGSQMYVSPEYLVVDTAVYPHGTVKVKAVDFSLRLTLQGNRHHPDETLVLRPQTPALVGYTILSGINAVPADMRNPGGQRKPSPQTIPRPSDQTAPQDSGAPGPEAVTAVVTRMALPEGVTPSGQAGYLYFAFPGKTKQIKELELIYGEGETALVVKLF